jgi:hypothetical protein
MISIIPRASIQKRNSKMLRRIDPRVSNFGMNFALLRRIVTTQEAKAA